jgi:putative oxidoreductase
MHLIYPVFASVRGSIALFLLRLVTGAAFLFHGWPKILNPFGWMGPDAPVPGILQALAAVCEFVGGIGLIVGLLTPLFSFLLAGVMVVAITQVHLKAGDPFVASGPGQHSWELAAVYLVIVVTLLLLGPGKLSVDAFLFNRRPKPPI